MTVYILTLDLRSWDRTVEGYTTREDAVDSLIAFAVDQCDAPEDADEEAAMEAINGAEHSAWIDEVEVQQP